MASVLGSTSAKIRIMRVSATVAMATAVVP
jgi:hypothetical protein